MAGKRTYSRAEIQAEWIYGVVTTIAFIVFCGAVIAGVIFLIRLV